MMNWNVKLREIEKLEKQCIGIKLTNNLSMYSKFGGLPEMSGVLEWPMTDDDVPMVFLAEIDGNEVMSFWNEKVELDNRRLFFFLAKGFPIGNIQHAKSIR